MSRVNVVTDSARNENLCDSNDLTNLVESYIEHKAVEKENKDLASSENTQIKAIMNELNINSFTSDSGTVKIIEKHSVKFIEDALIEFLKSHNVADGIVKTKEYVDMDALESAMYNEKISLELQKQMSGCKEEKIITELRISGRK